MSFSRTVGYARGGKRLYRTRLQNPAKWDVTWTADFSKSRVTLLQNPAKWDVTWTALEGYELFDLLQNPAKWDVTWTT